MSILQLSPTEKTVSKDMLIESFDPKNPHLLLKPFEDSIISFCDRLSEIIIKSPESRNFPELIALAFWMRKNEILKLKKSLSESQNADTISVPRGVTFHIAPANVDTIFLYSWLVSFMMGNRNILRVSNRNTSERSLIYRFLNQAILEYKDQDVRIYRNTVVLTYPHDEAITQALSGVSDTRLIWGGNHSVNSIRKIPMGPFGKDLTFPDRYSFALIHAENYLRASEEERDILCERFYNDTFWFDQRACSSPRALIWCGSQDIRDHASKSFFKSLVQMISKKGFHLEASTSIQKFTFVCEEAMDHNYESHERLSDHLTLLRCKSPQDLTRKHCGAGLLFETRIDQISDLSRFNWIDRPDQTLTHFGFSKTELQALAYNLNGRGIDRIVSIGEALQFNRFWDGFDLLRELSREVYVK